MVLPKFTSTTFGIYPTSLPASLWPSLDTVLDNSPALSPPINARSSAFPFTISPQLYISLLDPRWPIGIGLSYAILVSIFNMVNRRRKYRPWALSRTSAFWMFQVCHNVFLALYSAWTFTGMLRAFQQAWVGLDTDYGVAAAADSLCKINGPRGLGKAATFATETGGWSILDPAMRLVGGVPDPTDLGRIWNEGLAFYGWLFYISKFYEVVDTFLILAKGRQSSFLQTYHHTGAMLSMWAGIRFMSPPIWMFTFINSFIHTLMYTYFTFSSLSLRVPLFMKKTLTALQILQIVFGTSYALAHFFIAYDVPFYAAYRVVDNLSTAIPSATASASSVVSSVTASASLGSWLKKVVLRAAGEEGLAENVRDAHGHSFGTDAVHAADVQKAQEYINYKPSIMKTHCLDTSGQVLAILLNVAYLIPLSFLFIRFFIQYFTARTRHDPRPEVKDNMKLSAQDSARDTKQQFTSSLKPDQGGATKMPAELKAKIDQVKSKSHNVAERASGEANKLKEQVQRDLQAVREQSADLDQGGYSSSASTPQSKSSKRRQKKQQQQQQQHAAQAAVSGDPRAYEVNPDLPKSLMEKRADEAMQ